MTVEPRGGRARGGGKPGLSEAALGGPEVQSLRDGPGRFPEPERPVHRIAQPRKFSCPSPGTTPKVEREATAMKVAMGPRHPGPARSSAIFAGARQCAGTASSAVRTAIAVTAPATPCRRIGSVRNSPARPFAPCYGLRGTAGTIGSGCTVTDLYLGGNAEDISTLNGTVTRAWGWHAGALSKSTASRSWETSSAIQTTPLSRAHGSRTRRRRVVRPPHPAQRPLHDRADHRVHSRELQLDMPPIGRYAPRNVR